LYNKKIKGDNIMSINRLYITDHNGEVFNLDTGYKNSRATDYSDLSDSYELISKKLFSILSKSEYINLYGSQDQVIHFKKDFNIIEILKEIQAAQINESKNYSSRGSLSKIISSLLLEHYKINKTAREKAIDEIILYFGSDYYKTYRTNEDKNSPRNIDIMGSSERQSRIAELVTDIFKIHAEETSKVISIVENQLNMEELYYEKKANLKIPYTYEYLKNIITFHKTFINFGWNFISHTRSITEHTILKYSEEILNDPNLHDEIKKTNFYFIGSIARLTNKNLSKLAKVVLNIDDVYDIHSKIKEKFLFIMELYKRKMYNDIISLMDESKIYIIFDVIRDNFIEYVDYYKDELKFLKDQILSNINEINVGQLLIKIQLFLSYYKISQVLDFVFDKPEAYDCFKFMKERSRSFKKALVESFIHYKHNFLDIGFFPDDESKYIKHSHFNSLYHKLGLLIKNLTDVNKIDVDLTKEINMDFFKSLASASSSEKKIVTRMLSLFVNSDKVSINSDNAEIAEEQKQKILIFMEEMSKSTLKNLTLESIMKNTTGLYENSLSKKWFIQRTTSKKLMFGKEYSQIHEIIENSDDIRDIVKSTLLLLILN